MKIYAKPGIASYKEKKLKKALEDFFTENPDKYAGYEAPTDFETLKMVHDKYIVEEGEIISETTNEPKSESTHQQFRDSMVPEPELFPQEDPMNRDSPKIRDYVLDDGFSDTTKKEEPKSNYDEPTSFKDSFSLPDDNIQADSNKGKTSSTQNPFNSPPPPKKEAGPADPDAKIKKKSRKKFTKHAVNAVCALAGKGIIWFATKDITDAALAKAISNDEISQQSLDLLVFLDNGTQGAVKTFFQQAISNAQDLGNFTQDEKDDLIEALDDFLDYKKIEINPGIELMAVFMGLMLDKAIKALVLKAQSGSILQQLKDMHNNTEYQDAPEETDMNKHTEQEHADPANKEAVAPVVNKEPEYIE